MICEKCGEVCQCPMEPPPNHLTVPDSAAAAETALLERESSSIDIDPDAWRRELSARLNRYRSRRKVLPPRYPSLRLPFGPAAPALTSPSLEESRFSIVESAANHPLADEPEPTPSNSQTTEETLCAPGVTLHHGQSGAKILEFPRLAWAAPPPPLDQLAEPVIDRPRILEVSEVAPPPPALGGITIEPAAVEEPEKQPGIDVPLQNAPLGRRMLASAIDGLIIGMASALFGFIFWKITLVRPPHVQLLGLGAGIPCVFWVLYQFLLTVYAGNTPGLRLARLQLSRFDGTPTRRSLRRWRVLASYLSAASLGMGYLWLFLDEYGLCWHDRITHTYLAPRKQDSKN